MLNVNDDMDELMRRAAENYPLKTDGGDFEKVLERIKSANSTAQPGQTKSNKRNMLWLLLLLPFTYICNRYSKINEVDVASTPSVTIEMSKPSTASGGKTDPGNYNSKLSNSKGAKTAGKYQEGAPGYTPNQRVHELAKAHKETHTKGSVASNGQLTQKQVPINKSQPFNAVVKSDRTSFQQLSKAPKATTGKGEQELDDNSTSNKAATENKTVAGTQRVVDANASVVQDDPTLREVYQDEVKHLEMSKLPDSNKNTISPVASAIIKAKEKNAGQSKVYAGLMAGPDVSMVKNISISKVGYSFGLIAGYRAGKKISLESGLMWSKRFYKSEGKYFDTKKLPIPAYVKIIELDGYCQMYELPIGITYQLKSGKKNTWFSALGFSTYFMKNEDYTYKYSRYGQQNTRSVNYNNSVNNWFSILNVSVGLNKKIAKNALLRVQPYVKIPLKGIGIGSLPVSGVGVYASVVKNIF